MRVIDVRKREKPMQECLDGGTWATWLVEAVCEVVHHLAIAHALAFEQGKHILQKQPGKRGFRDGRQIRAGAFDPQDTRRTTAKIDLLGLGRGVATSPVADRAISSQLTRTSDQLRQRRWRRDICHSSQSFIIRMNLLVVTGRRAGYN